MACGCNTRLEPVKLLPGDGLPLLFDLSDAEDPEAAVFDEGDRAVLVLTAYDKTWEVGGAIDGNSVRALISGEITQEIGKTRVRDAHFCLHIFAADGERRTVEFGIDEDHSEGQYWYPVTVARCHPES